MSTWTTPEKSGPWRRPAGLLFLTYSVKCLVTLGTLQDFPAAVLQDDGGQAAAEGPRRLAGPGLVARDPRLLVALLGGVRGLVRLVLLGVVLAARVLGVVALRLLLVRMLQVFIL